MFGWRRNRYGEPNSLIDRDTVIEGPLQSRGVMEIRGRVTGAVVHNGRLIVAQGGCCGGPVQADELHIYGEVQGDVNVAGILHIGNGGSLNGDVTCGRLVVDAGGTFLGRNRVGEAGAAETTACVPAQVELPPAPQAEAETAPVAEAERPAVTVAAPAVVVQTPAAPEPTPKPAPKPDDEPPDTVTFHGFMRKR